MPHSPLLQCVGPSIVRNTPSLEAYDVSLGDWVNSQQLPLVYVSFGADSDLPARELQRVEAQLLSMDIAVLWSLPKPKQEALSWPLPDSWRVDDFVPQTAVLSHAKVVAFLSHCGANSCYEAILLGVPLLGVPGSRDQHFNAARMQSAGVGVVSRRGIRGVRAGLERVLTDQEGFNGRILRLRELLQSQGGAVRAVDIMELAAHLKGFDHLRPRQKRPSWTRRALLALFLLAAAAWYAWPPAADD